MRTTIDRAGRLVVPKELREKVGLTAGPVEVQVDGSGLRVEPVADGELADEAGRLVVAPSGVELDDSDVALLRDALQR